MKLLCSSDWHIRHTNPQHRIDDFVYEQFKKIQNILDITKDNKAKYTLVAGDVFNSARTPLWLLLRYYVDFCMRTKILAVPGQHDLKYHNKKEYEDTPLNFFQTTGVIGILNKTPFHIGPYIDLYGCWWEDKIPKIKDKGCFNILVIHKMVTDGGPEWYGQTEYTNAKKLLKKTGFDLIVSGDNHRPFVVKYKKQTLINPGSIVRQKANELDVKPRVYLFDTETRKVKKVYIPIEPAEKVFDLIGINKQEQHKENAKLRELISTVDVDKKEVPNFTKILASVIRKLKPNKKVVEKIDMFREKADEESNR